MIRRRTIEVTTLPRCHSYVTRHARAESARLQSEAHMEAERSGAIRRRELRSKAERLQSDLQRSSEALRRIGEDTRCLAAALAPLPATTVELERWLEQAALLQRAVNAALPRLTTAWEERKYQEREEHVRLLQERERMQFTKLEKLAASAFCGGHPSHQELEHARLSARILLDARPRSLSRQEIAQLRLWTDLFLRASKRWQKQEKDLDWRYEWERCPFLLPPLSREERDRILWSRYWPRTHRTDPDQRRRWRREKRAMDARF